MTGKMPASTTYEPVVVTITVPGQNHLYFRRPYKLADRLNGFSDLPKVTAVIVCEPSGLTSTWRDQS